MKKTPKDAIVNVVEDDNIKVTTYKTDKDRFFYVIRSFYHDPYKNRWVRNHITLLEDDLPRLMGLLRSSGLYPKHSLEKINNKLEVKT